MEWTEPEFSKTEVDSAGFFLFGDSSSKFRFGEDYSAKIELAYNVVSNWRASHNFPLNSLQKLLRKWARKIENDCLVAQRIKRISSINAKIIRFPTMRLSMMQDIGGCRAVMSNVDQVRKLVLIQKRSTRAKHEITKEDDYIERPKKSGYRGIHLIYRFYSEKTPAFNGLKVEMQLRTLLQHAWATAVETVGTFTQQALKSSQGGKEWLRFFALIGSSMAIREGTNLVPETPGSEQELKRELRQHAVILDVKNQLHAYGSAVKELTTPDSRDKYYLLELDPSMKEIKIKGYRDKELERASADYIATERTMREGNNAVLVSIDSIAALRRAFPNYFMDTRVFLDALDAAIL